MTGTPFANVPPHLSAVEIVSLIHGGSIGASHISALQKNAQWNDQMLAECLAAPVRKLRAWKSGREPLPEKVQEHVLLLLSLFSQGKEVFETVEDFNSWLLAENFHFGGKAPLAYLKIINGIHYVSARLTGMAYGDNA